MGYLPYQLVQDFSHQPDHLIQASTTSFFVRNSQARHPIDGGGSDSGRLEGVCLASQFLHWKKTCFNVFWLENPGLKMDGWLGLTKIVIYNFFMLEKERNRVG